MSLLSELQAMYDPASRALVLDTSKLGALGVELATITGGTTLAFGEVGAPPLDDTGTIKFSGASLAVTGGIPLLSFTTGKMARVTCAVYSAKTAPVLVITAVPGPELKLSDAVPSLRGTFWDELVVVTDPAVAAPALLLSTGAVQEPSLGVSLSRGISLSATLDETHGPLASASFLLGAQPRAFGSIVIGASLPTVTLGLTLPNAAGGLGGILAGQGITISARLTDAGLCLDVPLTWAGAPVTLEAVLPGFGAGQMELALDGPLSLPSPADAAQYLGGTDVTQYLPSQIKAGLGAIHVSRVALGIGLGTRKLDYARVTLTALESQRFVVVPGVIEVGNLSFTVTVFGPGTAEQQTFHRLSGTLDVGGVDLEVSADLVPTPRSPVLGVVARLDEGSLDLPMIARKLGLPDGAPAIAVTELTLGASTAGSYSVDLALESYQVGSGDAPFVLDDITLQIAHDGADTTLDLSSRMHVAGVDLAISISNQDGWAIAGDAGSDTPIAIGALIDDLGHRFGVSAPDAVKSLVLQNLHLGYHFSTGVFEFKVEGDFTLASMPVVMTVAIDVAPNAPPAKGHAGAFAATVALMGLTFAVDLSTAGNKTISLAFPAMKLGDALERLVALIDPNFQLDVGYPWSAILDVDLAGKVLVFDTTTKSISLTAPSGDLAHVDLFGLASATLTGITYTKGQSLKIDGSFKVVGLDPQTLDWDVVNQPPPALPSAAPRALEVSYLGLGQHVALTSTSDLTTVAEVIDALKNVPVAQDPTTSLHDLKFDASAGWLIGFDLTIKDAIRIAAIFNDPALYGLRISLKGGLVGKLDGLSFEILYRKIADGLGLYHIDLLLPLLMRHLEFGAVSVTLPHIIVDIYTNGNFLVDFGFPYQRDFSQSMMIEVFPFVGAGGFYFGVLDSSTTSLVPRADIGSFQPVIAFGFGLQVGLGKTFEAGPLSAGITITVEGILEGVLAFWKNDSASETYFKLSGTVAISAHVWGSVDFVIVSASIDVYVFVAVQLQIESHQPIFLELSAGVSVSASARVCGLFTVHFHFSTTIHESFTIGSASHAPWKQLA